MDFNTLNEKTPHPQAAELPTPVSAPKKSRSFGRELKLIGITILAYTLWNNISSQNFNEVWKRCCLGMSKSHTSARIVRQSHGLHGGIAWSSCIDLTEFDCAYLTVPMNYLDPHPNLTVSVALRRYPAYVSPSERKGTLFINPGGPGGSGTNAVVRMAETLSTILEGKYDILGFDPRAVNQTTPGLNCYDDAGFAELHAYELSQLGTPYMARLYPEASPYLHKNLSLSSALESFASSESETAFFNKWDLEIKARVKACKEKGNQEMLKSVSTAFVTRDMIRILEALGEDEGGINYWGFSYGTILGSTFSAMHPQYVNRVLVDGVSDSVTYTNDAYAWGMSGMKDNDKTYRGFLSLCVEAGPAGCALVKNGSTVESIHESLVAMSASLLSNPLPIGSSSKGAGILTAGMFQASIFQILYSPKGWQSFAQKLNDLLEFGNGKGIFEATSSDGSEFAHKKWDDNIFRRPLDVGSGGISTNSILCGDTKKSVSNHISSENFRHWVHDMNKIAPWSGDSWLKFIGPCRNWDFEPYEAYRGPWTKEEGLQKTKFPVLFVGNTADPVTPLAAAKSMSEGFGSESATLLIQDGYGHCSTAHPSLCTAKKVRSYFLDGEVPEYGTVCTSESGFAFPTPESKISTMSEEDEKLLKAWERLGDLLYM